MSNNYDILIKNYETLSSYCPVILEIAQGYNGKALNSRFCKYLEENALKKNLKIYACYAMNPYQNGHHELRVYSEELGYHYMIVDIYSCESVKVVEFNRFNYENFEKVVLSDQSSWERESERLKEDMKTGLERLKECNNLILQAQELANQFSQRFKDDHKLDFEKFSL